MIDLEFPEFEMQYCSGIAEALDAAGIDYSVHADIAGSHGPSDEAIVPPAARGEPQVNAGASRAGRSP